MFIALLKTAWKSSIVKQLVGAGTGATVALVAYGAWTGVSSLLSASVSDPQPAVSAVPPTPAEQDMPSQEEIDRMIGQAKDIIRELHEKEAGQAAAPDQPAEPVELEFAGQ